MKPEMTDIELGGLESRLRRLRPTQAPAAPETLRRFLVTVPATQVRRPRSTWFARSVVVRRGALLAGIAAALVVAIAGSALIVGLRASQTAGPAAAADWRWQKADGTILGEVNRVANGFIGRCTPAGADATPTDAFGQMLQLFGWADAAPLCTSPDGSTWTSPPDPRIADFPAGSGFSPGAQAQLGDVNLIAGAAQDSAGNSVSHLWRSTDGVAWQSVVDAQLQNLSVMALGVVDGRFMGVAMDVSTATGWVIASADGRAWQRTGRLPAEPNSAVVAGGLMVLDSPGNVVRMSRDGSTWQEVVLPAGVGLIGGVTQLAGGGYLALGVGSGLVEHLLRSDDGISWRIDDGDAPGSILSVTRLGDRFVASILEGAVPAQATSLEWLSEVRLWQSLDDGHTWSRVIGPEGSQMSGFAIALGDALGVVVRDAQNAPHLEWVGRTAVAVAPTVSPSPSAATATTSATAPATATGTPVAPPSVFEWIRGDGTGVTFGFEVGRLFVGLCSDAGGWQRCGSFDGANWDVPATNQQVIVQGSDSFWPIEIAQGAGTSVAVSLSPLAVPSSTPEAGSAGADATPSHQSMAHELWRTVDGVTWARAGGPALDGVSPLAVAASPSGFFAVGNAIADGHAVVLTSPDGITWAVSPAPIAAVDAAHVTPAGLYLTGVGPSGATETWRSLNGLDWGRVSVPQGVAQLIETIDRGGGAYLGLADSSDRSGDVILGSTDGLTWHQSGSLPAGYLVDLAACNGTLVATMSGAPDIGGPFTVWQSVDWGETWAPLVDPSGQPVSGKARQLGPDVVIALQHSGAWTDAVDWLLTPARP